jgi:tRNA1Val (adenine37-N6)-methyltransferase
MSNNQFNFKQFTINQDKSAFKVGTDGVLLGASADTDGVRNILDIGSGTGLISLMLAQRCNAEITAIEPDYESFLQTCENVNRSPWSERIKVIHTNFQNLELNTGRFDMIVTNPPFFKDSLKNPDPRKSAARHDEYLSNEEILQGTLKFMKEDGTLQLILPYVEGNIFIAKAHKYGFYCNSIIKVKPVPSAEIRRLILKFSSVQKKPSESFLTIEHGKRHEFTEEYVDLTKEFYLKF